MAQVNVFGIQDIDEFHRRSSLKINNTLNPAFNFRYVSGSPDDLFFVKDSIFENKKFINIYSTPIYFKNRIDFNRPYFGGEFGMIPSRGFQSFFSTGFYGQLSILHFQLQPELVYSQNLPFQGFPDTFSSSIIESRFLSWNYGDTPEKFGTESYKKFFFGQSSINLRYGAFQFGFGTNNFWWGPGQWNSLIFSNNSPGFPYLSLNTIKPAKTFLGSFEGQVLIGRLESSNQAPTQIESLNNRFFRRLNPDWRYLNGLMVSYSPKWISSLSLGFARTFQYYNADKPKDFFGWLPIFEPMAKEYFFVSGNSVEYDGRRQSQQIAVFGRFEFKKSMAEIYFQFGRRDHALNWREFLLNPEHARAYQLGFFKLHALPNVTKHLQVRGEITHQQESMNRILRYGKQGGISWHTHSQLRGFTNYGQPMGVGVGSGSNVQTLEVAVVEDWKKVGLLLERLENNQDFYYRAFGQQLEIKPWIDWSAALVWNTSYKDLFLSARLQGTYARNYYWGLSKTSTTEFPVSEDLFSGHSQLNVIYFIKSKNKK